jgi:hypothetical protein
MGAVSPAKISLDATLHTRAARDTEFFVADAGGHLRDRLLAAPITDGPASMPVFVPFGPAQVFDRSCCGSPLDFTGFFPDVSTLHRQKVKTWSAE